MMWYWWFSEYLFLENSAYLLFVCSCKWWWVTYDDDIYTPFWREGPATTLLFFYRRSIYTWYTYIVMIHCGVWIWVLTVIPLKAIAYTIEVWWLCHWKLGTEICERTMPVLLVMMPDSAFWEGGTTMMTCVAVQETCWCLSALFWRWPCSVHHYAGSGKYHFSMPGRREWPLFWPGGEVMPEDGWHYLWSRSVSGWLCIVGSTCAITDVFWRPTHYTTCSVH